MTRIGMPTRILSGENIRAALSTEECAAAMADAMVVSSEGRVVVKDRQAISLADGSGFIGLMAGSCRAPRADGVKVVSIKPDNSKRGKPALQGLLLLFDDQDGSPAALIDAAELTLLRTAALSLLATRRLARSDARTVAILGCGAQARAHVAAMAQLEGAERILVWGRNIEAAEQLAALCSDSVHCPVEAVRTVPDAAKQADVICCVTSASRPVLFGRWVRPGTHVNLIGSHDANHAECDPDLIAKSRLFTDNTEAALTQAGEIVTALSEGIIAANHISAEIGELIRETARGRHSNSDITVFKSIGLIAQDLLAAELALRNANTRQIGETCQL